MPIMNRDNGNGTITVGWDSTESSVDECELKPIDFGAIAARHRELPKPSDNNPTYDRLVDIGNIVSRAKRDISTLQRITERYQLDPAQTASHVSIIAIDATNTVRRMMPR